MEGITLDGILQALESKKTHEQVYHEKIAQVQPVTAETTEAQIVDNDLAKTAEMEKIAEWDAQGRIMARSFVDELTKIAQVLENTEALPATEEQDTQGANNIINKLIELNF